MFCTEVHRVVEFLGQAIQERGGFDAKADRI